MIKRLTVPSSILLFISLFTFAQVTFAHDGIQHSIFAPPEYLMYSNEPYDADLYYQSDTVELELADSSQTRARQALLPLDASGEWSDVIDLSIIPVGAANQPDGNLLLWAGEDRDAWGNADPGQTYTSVFDPGTLTATERLVSETGHNMFCPGTTNLPDGRLLISGGSSASETTIYDPFSSTWSSDDDLNIPRGYHSHTMLGDGDVFTIGGSWSGGKAHNKHGELWNVSSGWEILDGIPVDAILDGISDPQGIYREDNHAWIWTAPNGKILHVGPSTEMKWFDTSGDGSYSDAGSRGDDTQSPQGNTVMYDVGKILKLGGAEDSGKGGEANNRTYIIDVNSNSAQVTRQGNMKSDRALMNSVVLPTGEVVAVGGRPSSQLFSDTDAYLNPEIWNPETGEWRDDLAQMAIPRTYHSVAILLPDGRIFAGGGGLCNNCDVNHLDAEIFSPPYLFDGNNLATRPVINSAPSAAANGDTINVKTNSSVTDFALVRLSSVTHSINNDQRRIPLTPSNAGSNSYNLTLPANSNVLLPGYYMLFAMDSDGTPSVSKTIHISADGSTPPISPPSGDSLRVEAENYTSQSGIKVTSGRDGNNNVVSYIKDGDSTTYAINMPESGTVQLSARVASKTSGGVLTFILGGENIGSITVPGTGSWDKYTTLYTQLSIPSASAGNNKTLVLEYSGGSGYLFDVNWVEFTFTDSPIPSITGTDLLIEAEDYTSQSGIKVMSGRDGNNDVISHIKDGDSTTYAINVPELETVNISARVASATSGGVLTFILGGEDIGSITVPGTGDWDKYTTLSTQLSIPSASTGNNKTLVLEYSGGNSYLFDVNWVEFAFTDSTAPPPPPMVGVDLLIEAEDYTSQSGTKIVSGRDGNNDIVGYIKNGSSTTYSINVSQSGSIEVSARVASDTNGGTINFILGGTNIGSITVPNTGGWDKYKTLYTQLSIPSALVGNNKTLVLEYSGGNSYLFDMNWVKFAFAGSSASPTTGVDLLIEAEDYTSQSGIKVVSGRDGNSDVVGYTKNGDSTTYAINVPQSGTVDVSARVASGTSGGVLTFILGGEDIGSITVPGTGDWDKYTTLSTQLSIPSAGNNKTLVLEYSGGNSYLFDVNWVEFAFGSSSTRNRHVVVESTAVVAENVTVVDPADVEYYYSEVRPTSENVNVVASADVEYYQSEVRPTTVTLLGNGTTPTDRLVLFAILASVTVLIAIQIAGTKRSYRC